MVRADAPDDIDVLLQSAARAIEQLRLTRPEGDNAYDYYHQVLAIDPGNAAANAGMDDIAARYTRMAQSGLDDGNTARASRYIERGLGVQPADATLQALRDEITRREQQRALAAAAAERKAVIGNAPVRVAIEAGVRQGWDAFIGEDGVFVGMHGFGMSGPYKEVYAACGITAQAAADAVRKALAGA